MQHRATRRSVLAASLVGAAAAAVSNTALSRAVAFAAPPGSTRTLVGHVDHLGHGAIVVTDPDSTSAVATVSLGACPNGITGAPNGRFAYVAIQYHPGLAVLDTAANQVTGQVQVGGFANSVVFAPDGSRAYVATGSSAADGSTGELVVVDTAAKSVTARITAGPLPHRLAIAPDGSRVYVADERVARVTVVDTARNAVTGTVATDGPPLLVAVAPDGRHLYVATGHGLTTVDTDTAKPTGTVPLGGVPAGLVLSGDGSLAFVSVYTGKGAADLVVVNTAAQRVQKRTGTGRDFGQLALDGPHNRLYLANPVGDHTAVLDATTTTTTGQLPAPAATHPNCVAVAQIA